MACIAMIKLVHLRLLSKSINTSSINKYFTKSIVNLSTTALRYIIRDGEIPPMFNDFLDEDAHHSYAETEPIAKYAEKIKARNVSKQKTRILKPMQKYYAHIAPAELDAFPLSEARKRPRDPPKTLRVATQQISDEILAQLMCHRKPNVPLFEINPGPGFLSNKLLKAGVNQLRLIEESSLFNNTLNAICAKYPEKCQYTKFNYSSLQKFAHDYVDKTKYPNIFDGIIKQKWEDDISHQLFVCSGNDMFLRQLVFAITYQNGWLEYGRGEYFLVLPIEVVTKFFGFKQNRKNMPIILEIYFEHMFIVELEKAAFIPWWTRNYINTKMVLIKLVPRRNLLSLCKAEDLPGLLFFIRQIVRKHRIIPSLEEWIPGCAKNIIFEKSSTEKLDIIEMASEHLKQCTTMSNCNHYDITQFTGYSALDASHIFTLFNQFRNLDEYEHSKFAESIPGPYRKIDLVLNKRKILKF